MKSMFTWRWNAPAARSASRSRRRLDTQDAVEDRTHEVFVVHAVEFHEDVARSGDEMRLHDFGDFLELLHGLLEQLRVFERDADVGADVEAHHLGVYDQAAAQDHARIVELADALVDRSARDAAFAGDLEKRHARILDQVFEDLAVDCV